MSGKLYSLTCRQSEQSQTRIHIQLRGQIRQGTSRCQILPANPLLQRHRLCYYEEAFRFLRVKRVAWDGQFLQMCLSRSSVSNVDNAVAVTKLTIIARWTEWIPKGEHTLISLLLTQSQRGHTWPCTGNRRWRARLEQNFEISFFFRTPSLSK